MIYRSYCFILKIHLQNSINILGPLTDEEYVQCFYEIYDILYRYIDKVTRATGRLTKISCIIDNTNAKLGIDKKSRRNAFLQTKASSFSVYMYPQMQGSTIIANLPMVMVYLYKIIKPFLSPKMISKVKLVRTTPTSDFSKCSEILELIDSNSLPRFWGGLCQCDGGCIRKISE